MKTLNAPDFAAGEKIGEPGIYSGISMDRYHSDLCDGHSLSSSGLRTIFLDSLADFWASSIYNPNRIEENKDGAERRHFILGRAAHHLLLGEKGFAKLYIQRPLTLAGEAWQGNRKVCREWLVEQERKKLTVYTAEEANHIIGMRNSLRAEPMIRAGILDGKIEQSLFWRDDESGVWLKSRPDAIPTDSLDLADLKTASSVDEESISRAIDDYGYHIQIGVAAWGFRVLTGRALRSFTLIFVKSKPPYSVSIVELDETDVAAGEQIARLAVKAFARALKSGDWPGPMGHQTQAKTIKRKPWNVEAENYRFKRLQKELEA